MYYINSETYHTFKKYDKYFLFNIHNLAALEIGELMYKITSIPQKQFTIESISEDLHINDIELMKSTIHELLDCEVVLNKEPKRIIYKNNVNSFNDIKSSNNFINGLYLAITSTCNLRCKYCSAGYGNYGQKNIKKLMSLETAKKAIDFLIDNMENGLKSPLIVFSGGEPLLNIEVLKFVVEYFKEFNDLKPHFIMNTNATLMNHEMAQWLVENDIDIRFSVDGLKIIHDKNRIYPNGKGSFDDTLKGIKIYQNYKKGFKVQSSIPHSNRLIESIKYLWEQGAYHVLANITADSTYVNTEEYKMNEKEWSDYANQMEILNTEIINRILNNDYSPDIHSTNKYLIELKTRKILPDICGIGRTINVTADENIYMCQLLQGKEEYFLGNLDSGINVDTLIKFGDVYAKYRDKCQSCWAMNICKANCIAMSIDYNEMEEKDEPSRWCWLSKNQLEYAIYMYNYIMENNPKVIDKLLA